MWSKICVSDVRERIKSGVDREQAVDEVVNEYIARGGDFGSFLLAHRAEVVDMFLTEYNEERHERSLKEEGKLEEHKKMSALIRNLIKDGLNDMIEKVVNDDNLYAQMCKKYNL